VFSPGRSPKNNPGLVWKRDRFILAFILALNRNSNVSVRSRMAIVDAPQIGPRFQLDDIHGYQRFGGRIEKETIKSSVLIEADGRPGICSMSHMSVDGEVDREKSTGVR
jgi:hypothetical protein